MWCGIRGSKVMLPPSLLLLPSSIDLFPSLLPPSLLPPSLLPPFLSFSSSPSLDLNCPLLVIIISSFPLIRGSQHLCTTLLPTCTCTGSSSTWHSHKANSGFSFGLKCHYNQTPPSHEEKRSGKPCFSWISSASVCFVTVKPSNVQNILWTTHSKKKYAYSNEHEQILLL